MGHTVIEMATESPEFSVVAGIDPHGEKETSWDFPVYQRAAECREEADAIVDFSQPEGVVALLPWARERGIPMVVATTGLDEKQKKQLQDAAEDIPVFQAANMSLGVNLLKLLIKKAASVLGSGFDIEIVEKHHRMKKDAPSGTALALADALAEVLPRKPDYVFGRQEKDRRRADGEIGIHAVRAGSIVGEHEVIFAGPDEVVELGHKAYSRRLFASGALKAAGFLKGQKPGFYGMEEMLAEVM